MSSRLKVRGHQKRRSGKPYERKSVLEKVKEFFTPSYWLGTGGPTDDDPGPHDEQESRHIFNPPYTHPSDNPCTSQTTQSDPIIIDDTQSDTPMPSSSVGKRNEKGSQAWKNNMISLNEDMETGPSQVFQNEVGATVISSSESTSVNALHNTKLFIPASLNTPQHSTPLKKSDQISTQSGSVPAPTNVSNEMDTLPEQQVATTAGTRKESATSSSAAPQLELHQSGSGMLTPPDSPSLDSHAGGNRTRGQSHHLTSIVSPSRFNIPHGQGPLRSPYYSGRTTFGGAASQVKMRTVKRRRSEDNQTSPELPPVRQQLHARPATHQTIVASQTAKQILESLKNYSTPVSNAKRFPIRSPVTSLMSPKESVVPAAKRHRTKPTSADKQHEEIAGPPVNPLLTPYKAHIMTLPPVTPPTDDRLHSNPITMTTTAQPMSTHKPHPLAAAASTSTSNSLSTIQQGLFASRELCTNETSRLKETLQDSGQPVSEGFTAGWVGGASGKIKEKKHSLHESHKGDDEQINPMEMPKAVPLQLSSSGKLPSFSFTPGFLQKKGDSHNNDDTVSKGASIPSVAAGVTASVTAGVAAGLAYNFSQPKAIVTGSKSTPSKEPVKFSFSTPKQHSSETAAALVPVVPAVSSVSLPTCSVPPRISFPSQLNVLPSTQPLSLSGSSAAVKSSERKPLPLKTGSCLEILTPYKPVVDDKTAKEDPPSKPSLPSNSLLSQKFKPAEGSWECPSCMVNNKATDDKCVACTTSRPGSAPAATTATALSTGAASTSLAPQQLLLSQKFKPAEGSWECPACMVNNKATDDKCVACTTSTATAGAVSTSSAPQQSLLSQKFKPAEGSWECPACMVNNKATDDKCAACTTSRPGSAPAGLSSAPSGSSGQSTGLTMGSSGGLQLGSSGGFKLGSSGGLQLGSSGGFKLGITKSEPATVSEPISGGLKLESSGGLQLGSGGGLKLESSGGFKLGLSGDLKLGSGGNLKVGSSSDTKLGTSSNLTFSSGSGLQLGSNSALQMGSTNSNNPLPPSNIIITTTITSGFSSSSSTTQSLSTRFKLAEGSWECPACMVNNKATDDKCAACTTSRPGSAPAATAGASSTEGNTLLSMPGPGIKFGATGGLQLGSLSQNVSSNSSSKPMLLGIQPSLPPLTTKPLETGSSSSGGLQLGSGSGLQLGTGGLQLGSSSGGIKLGLPTSVQPASGEAIKLTGSAEGASVTNNLGGVLLGKKRSLSHTEDETASASIFEPVMGNNSLVGNPLGLVPLNKPAVTTAKSVTFKLDGDNKTDNSSNNTQMSFGIPQPSSSGALTTGFPLVGSLTASGDGKLPATSDSSSVKPFANLFPPKSTTTTLNFAFPKPTSAASTLTTTSSSTLLNPSLSFNTGLSSSTTTTSTEPPKLFNFAQQSLFTTPAGQGQQGTSSGLDLKLPTCQEKKENSGNVTFNFSGAKSNQLLASQGQQGMSSGLGLTQATTQQGFNFHGAMQNQVAPFFNTNLGSSGLITTSTSSSVLFTDQLNTNQADNASGMEISNPATGEPQHLPSLTAPVGQGLQLQFGGSNNPPSQPFVFNSQQQNQNMFEGNSSNLFGANNPVLGGNLPASMVFSATPSITNRPIKRARRRIPNRP